MLGLPVRDANPRGSYRAPAQEIVTVLPHGLPNLVLEVLSGLATCMASDQIFQESAGAQSKLDTSTPNTEQQAPRGKPRARRTQSTTRTLCAACKSFRKIEAHTRL